MPKKQKRVNKTKDQLIAESMQKFEAERKRRRAKEELYPLLVESSHSVEDAKTFCTVTSTVIRQAFNGRLRTMKLKELKLDEQLDPQAEQHDKYKKLLDTFSEETIFNALELIEGMGQAIDSFVREEMTTRKLDTLKTTFL